jgi:hypothetical protein
MTSSVMISMFTSSVVDHAMGSSPGRVYFQPRGRRGHDRMVVGFTTTCTISAYHH